VDIDPQANATVGLGHAKDARPSIYDVLTGDARVTTRSSSPRSRGCTCCRPTPTWRARTSSCHGRPGSETSLRDALVGVREQFAVHAA
jgi:chromosome partitioning protein